MKVAFPSKEDGFRQQNCTFCGIEAILINPELDAVWRENNLFYRSLIVDKQGNVLSSGWPKFFNKGEKSELYPDPETYSDWSIREKLDGSLLIADYVNDQFSMRTRGCASYTQQENSNEFELLIEKYPKIKDFLEHHNHISLLFEMVTPNHVIVIRPKEVEFYLIGAINKNGMCVVSSSDLLDIWRQIGCVPVPKVYQIDNIKDLSCITNLIKSWKGTEGVVVSYNKNQNRIKIKSDWYLFAHKVRSQLNSDANLIDLYVELGMPSYNCFFEKIQTEFDFELAQIIDSQIAKVSEAGEQAKLVIQHMKEFVASIRNFETRKQQAEHILATYSKAGRAPFVFTLLDHKPLCSSQLAKLIHQCLL